MFRYLLNFFSKLGVDAISRLLGLVTLPIIARTLGPEGYGIYTYVGVLYTYYGFFMDLGYTLYGTNELCKADDPRRTVDDIFSLQLTTALITQLVTIVSAYFLFESQVFVLITILSFGFLWQPLMMYYFYISSGRLYFTSVATLSGQVVFVLLVVTVYRAAPSLPLLNAFGTLMNLITGLVLFIPYYRHHGLRIRFRFTFLRATLKKMYKIAIAAKLEAITTSVTPLIMGSLLTAHDVGIYGAAYKVFLILFAVIQSMQYTLMPIIFKSYTDAGVNTKRLSILFYIHLTFGITFGALVYFASPLIINVLYGGKFAGGVGIMRYFSLTIMFWPILTYFGNALITLERFGGYLAMVIVSAASAVGFSFLFIIVFQLTGAALVLPLAAGATILTGLGILWRTSRGMGFTLREIFSPAATRDLLAGLRVRHSAAA